MLGHSRARGPARLLLAALAALADEYGRVDGLATEDLCRAAGLANSTYRRARTALLASGEVELVDDGGGRGRMNRWRVLAPAGRGQPSFSPASAPASAGTRPATAPLPCATGASDRRRI